MNSTRDEAPRDDADKVMQAVLRKMNAHREDLNQAHLGHVQFRKQNGKIVVKLTTTK